MLFQDCHRTEYMWDRTVNQKKLEKPQKRSGIDHRKIREEFKVQFVRYLNSIPSNHYQTPVPFYYYANEI